MKNSIFFSVLFAFILGAFLGSMIGIDPVISAVSFTVVMAFATTPKGATSINGLDVSQIKSDIEEYFKFYSNQVWVAIMKGSDFEQYMRKIPNVRNKYVSTGSRRGEMLQTYQKAWTPKGGVEMVPYVNTIFDMKMDLYLDNLHELFQTYLGFLADESKLPDQYPFVKWLVTYHVIPGMQEELRRISVVGEFNAPTPGTANDSIDTADGIFTIITREVADNNITPIQLGAITSSNIVDQLEKFNRDLPAEWVTKPGNIFLSSAMLQDYIYAYRDAFGQNRDFEGPTTKLWGTQKTLVGLDDLNGKDRILFTPDGPRGNLLCMYDKIINPTPYVFLEKGRFVGMTAQFARGWGFETLDVVFVNDSEDDEAGGGE